MENSQYLFVYGTLLSEYGDPESRLFIEKYAELVGKARSEGKMYMVDYYPGMIPCGEKEKYYVKGELYRLKEPEKLFSFLDQYEEYNPNAPQSSEYVRKETTVQLKSSSKELKAWVYYFNQSIEDLEFLPKGDFLNEYHK
jgi:gamma-glutamylcyclotransferase (GGCT)/AIG2-like uncharacterized protein YtfP